jgi:hypothetical protein
LASRYSGDRTSIGVQAQRHVVHEEPVADSADVDATLQRLAERVESAHHVVAVEAEIERDVVQRASGDAHERRVTAHGDSRDRCERTIASRDADHIGATVDRVLRKLCEPNARLEHQGFDPPTTRLISEVERSRAPMPRVGVEDQHAVACRADSRAARCQLADRTRVSAKRESGEADRRRAQCKYSDGEQSVRRPSDHDHHEQSRAADSDDDPDRAQQVTSSDREPPRDGHEQQDAQRKGEAPQLPR